MQTWTLRAGGRDHRVTADGGFRHAVEWWVDEELVATRTATEERIRLEADGHGSLEVRHSTLGAPRRATWHAPSDPHGPPDPGALAGLGGLDLTPEPGSPAAAYEQKLRDHPRRYATIQTAGGVAKVLVPILLTLLVITLPWPDLSLPAVPWPDVPWPDISLPAVPWPDISLPAVPWPDVTVPGWVRWLLDHARYVVPVVIAFVLARAELRRRRRQDELRQGARPEGDDTDPDRARE